jgi:aminomethyltransferase
MGEIEIAGADALAAVQKISSNDASRLAIGQIHYSALTTPDGTFVDDLLVYRMADDHFLLVVNASNIDKDYAWIRSQVAEFADAPAVNNSNRYALLALQGPLAAEVLQTLTAVSLADIKYYWFENGEVAGVRGMISRTGYTGEDGFEVMLPAAEAESAWRALNAAGVVSCGLGARDTLRLEAGMNLYGNDMDEQRNPLESGLAWTVAFEPRDRDFVGRAALEALRLAGLPSRLVGLVLEDRGVLRSHQKVVVPGVGEGEVTSGTFSPTLERSIGFARVPSATGAEVQVDIRGRLLRARVVKLPFVRRGRVLVAL